MTTGFDLDEIERLLAAATGGPWRKGSRRNCDIDIIGKPSWPCKRFGKAGEWDVAVVSELENTKEQQANAALIVTLRNSAPAMIAAIRELRATVAMIAEIRELRATVATLGDSARAGANVLDAKDTEIRELRAENARLKAVVCNYVDPFDVAPEDEALVERVQRAALGEPQ